jgi:myo-inositol-1(or 4)-monophosphatase
MPSIDLAEARDRALSWARDAGELVKRHFRTAVECERKSDHSPVTSVDLESHEFLRSVIHSAYPDHAILSEEDSSHCKPTAQTPLWIIDPLDGTRNFAHGFPSFSTSIALIVDDHPVVGVIYDPLSDHAYDAILGGGTRWNGRAVHSVSASTWQLDSMVGFPIGRNLPIHLEAIQELATRAILRNVGSTCLHLAAVASAALDGAYAPRAKVWDYAAGALMISEGGGVITTLNGKNVVPIQDDAYRGRNFAVVAAGRELHPELRRFICDSVPH